jgi:LemA protein
VATRGRRRSFVKLQIMKVFLSVLGVIVLLVVVLLIGGGCGSYNRLVTLKQQVDQSWADVENVYQRRADLIPNLVKTVEGAANFEKTTLTQVIQARQQVTNVQMPAGAPDDPAAMQKFQQSQDALSGALSRLLVTVERYPELKANANFQTLQTQLEGTENRITVERRKFNEVATSYNIAVKSFPAVLFAGAMGFAPHALFTAKAGAENAPEVSFDFGGKSATPPPPAPAAGTPVPATP